jgi:hypothetical protein
MKDIDQMNLAELANKLCDLHEGDTVGILRIADRMDKLHDLTRWIPISERMPTEEDVDENGEVIAYSPDPAITVSASGIPPSHHFTHWKRITPPEDKP